MVNLSPDKPKKKDPWFKRLTMAFGGVFYFIGLIGILGWGACNLFRNHSQNDACDKRCVSAGYPAGEGMSITQWKHAACVCWPKTPGPAAYFLLERDD